MRLSERLHAAAAPIWQKMLTHPFITGLGDGSLPLGPLMDAVATLLGEDGAELRERLVPLARELVADGFLEPA